MLPQINVIVYHHYDDDDEGIFTRLHCLILLDLEHGWCSSWAWWTQRLLGQSPGTGRFHTCTEKKEWFPNNCQRMVTLENYLLQSIGKYVKR